MKKIAFLFLGTTLLFVTANAHSLNLEKVEEIRLGEHLLEIPSKSLAESIPFWLRLIPGLAPSYGEILLRVGADELAEEISGYQVYDGKLKNDIYLRLEILDEKSLKQLLDSELHIYSDIWYGRGLYENRVVEEHAGSAFYKVYNKETHIFWAALRVHPDTTIPIPDDPFSFWVAECVERGAPMTSTGHITSCQSQFVHDDLLLDFSINEVNLHVIDAIKVALVKKMLSWKKHD